MHCNRVSDQQGLDCEHWCEVPALRSDDLRQPDHVWSFKIQRTSKRKAIGTSLVLSFDRSIHACIGLIEQGEDVKQPYSFLVFGAGGRTCLGMNLAKIMMLIFLHRLVTTFRFKTCTSTYWITDGSQLNVWNLFVNRSVKTWFYWYSRRDCDAFRQTNRCGYCCRWEMADDDTSLEKWAMFPRLRNGCPIHLTPIWWTMHRSDRIGW